MVVCRFSKRMQLYGLSEEERAARTQLHGIRFFDAISLWLMDLHGIKNRLSKALCVYALCMCENIVVSSRRSQFALAKSQRDNWIRESM